MLGACIPWSCIVSLERPWGEGTAPAQAHAAGCTKRAKPCASTQIGPRQRPARFCSTRSDTTLTSEWRSWRQQLRQQRRQRHAKHALSHGRACERASGRRVFAQRAAAPLYRASGDHGDSSYDSSVANGAPSTPLAFGRACERASGRRVFAQRAAAPLYRASGDHGGSSYDSSVANGTPSTPLAFGRACERASGRRVFAQRAAAPLYRASGGRGDNSL